MQTPTKHHHLPVFYLDRWTGADGRLCQFSQPYEQVKPKRLYPTQTGFVAGLYSMKGVPVEHSQQVEQRFMQPLAACRTYGLAA
jgi:hypothetical protein